MSSKLASAAASEERGQHLDRPRLVGVRHKTGIGTGVANGAQALVVARAAELELRSLRSGTARAAAAMAAGVSRLSV